MLYLRGRLKHRAFAHAICAVKAVPASSADIRFVVIGNNIMVLVNINWRKITVE